MDCVSGWCKSKRRLEGCTAIVTGSNTGIGKETALDFFSRGARVIMACRNLTKAEEAKTDIEKRTAAQDGTGALIIEKLDLCSLKSVKEFVERVLASENKINILVNNAGVMMCPQGKTEDGFETHIGSNHFGHALLTLLLLPLMAKSAPSRIVFVSSYLHAAGNAYTGMTPVKPGWNMFSSLIGITPLNGSTTAVEVAVKGLPKNSTSSTISIPSSDLVLDDINYERSPYDAYKAYCRSKAANVLFPKALARKLKEQNIEGVTTYSIHPGVIRTEISRHFDKTVWFGASWAFNNVGRVFLKSPTCGAQTTIYCAVDEACAEETGLYYSDCAPKLPSKQCQDDAVADKFWSLTVDALKYDPFTQGLVTKL